MTADGIGQGLIPAGADRQTILRIAGQQALAALGNLPPGSVFSGRVIAPTGDGTWQVAVRGGTITVASPVPLTADAVLRLMLVGGGTDGPLQVRLADMLAPGTPGLPASLTARLTALGLPTTPEAQAVLAAFEEVGAPLNPPRLRHAVAVLEQAAREPQPDTEPLEEEPPDSAPQRPLALRPEARATATPPGIAPPLAPPTTNATTATAGSLPRSPAAELPRAEVPPPRTPTTAPIPPTVDQPQPAGPKPSPITAPGTAPTLPGTPVQTAPSQTTTPPTLGADPRLPMVFALLAKADLPVTPATLAVALRAATVRLPDPVTAVLAWKPGTALPDIADDNPATALKGVLTALALAGVRALPTTTPTVLPAEPGAPHPQETSAPTSEAPAPRPLPVDEDAPPPLLTTVAQTLAKEPPSALGSAAMRELAADPLLPPRHLDDYDRVYALPLLAQGQATPARVAVASRTTPTGVKATWVRVDCELSLLGPVSVRLSGSEGGPIAITLVARPAGARAIAEELPNLIADLQSRGLPAAVRVIEEEPW